MWTLAWVFSRSTLSARSACSCCPTSSSAPSAGLVPATTAWCSLLVYNETSLKTIKHPRIFLVHSVMRRSKWSSQTELWCICSRQSSDSTVAIVHVTGSTKTLWLINREDCADLIEMLTTTSTRSLRSKDAQLWLEVPCKLPWPGRAKQLAWLKLSEACKLLFSNKMEAIYNQSMSSSVTQNTSMSITWSRSRFSAAQSTLSKPSSITSLTSRRQVIRFS